MVTQRAPDGSSASSASSPNLVAQMLEQLRAEPGNAVLEIGAATGFNAALLSSLTGPGGKVVTIEYDPGLADQAAANLHRAVPPGPGHRRDGALGHQEQGPYDRIIVTAEATDITAAWWDQLNPVDSRIVVPVRLHGSGLTRSLGLRRTGPGTMVADSAYVCGFVAMRGSGEQAEQQIRLDAGAALKVDVADQPDAAALSRVLHSQPDQRWTGIRVRDDEPTAHLDLWLLTMIAQGHGTGASFGRLSVTPDARSSGLADPALRWAEPACTRAAPSPGSPPGRPATAPGSSESTPAGLVLPRSPRPRSASSPNGTPAAPPNRSSPPPACPPNPEPHPAHPGGAARHNVHHRLVAGVAAPPAAGYSYAPGGLAARRFPLAPRPKPPCPPLTERLARVARLAGQVTDDADAPTRAAGACNLAALIASDCAMPELARVLCWAQLTPTRRRDPRPAAKPSRS